MSTVYEDSQLVIDLERDRRVVARFASPRRLLSFALARGGFQVAETVAIVGVRNADLSIDACFHEVLRSRIADLGQEVVAMMTSRDLTDVDVSCISHPEASAVALATVGLSNGVFIGDEPGELASWGTVNLLVHVDRPLSDSGLVEALSLVAEARTVAVLEAKIPSRRSASISSGTGTDCIAIACPLAETTEDFAGKHTAIGHVVGAAALEATRMGIARWRREVRP